jgi:hypothetical protein
MEKICKNCVSFETKEKNGKFGSCYNEKLAYGEEVKDRKDDMLIYYDYESYDAGFYVGINFGCIHWEGKERGQC